MINNISNVMNSKMRFTGLVSGLETDLVIQNMMAIERMKMNKVMQDRQILEWRQDDYRSITNQLRGFKDEFFDILKPASNMQSASTYYSYKAKSSDESVVTASGSGQVSMLNHSLEVYHLAEAANLKSVGDRFGEEGLGIYSTIEEVAEKYNIELVDNKLSFTINGEAIEIAADKKVNDLMSAINNSGANVKISYSSFLDKFTMTTKSMGEDAKIEITEGAEFFNAIGFDTTEVAKGKDAEFRLDGKLATRSSNVFNIDGVVYTLKGKTELNKPVNITLTQDTDAIFDKIKTFIDKYNDIVESLTSKINEERPKSGGANGSYFLPLTDEQREAMKDSEVEKWEENAKKGLLRNDSILEGVLFDLRRVMGDSTGAGTLSSIGISTGDWREGAKLFIDETKLKNAINENPDKIAEIFSKESEIRYNPDATGAERKQRYEESGIVDRLFDVLQDNIRTTRNVNGKKGVLLEKAGIIGDITEFQSIMSDEINKKNTLIEEMMRKLYTKEESLYQKFAALETAMSRMSAQSAWLVQSFGGMNM